MIKDIENKMSKDRYKFSKGILFALIISVLSITSWIPVYAYVTYGNGHGTVVDNYGTPIENGAFSIQINADEFAQIKNSSWGGYPNFFQDYLVKKGILPKFGFLHIPEPVQNTIMHELNSKVERHWSRICKEV